MALTTAQLPALRTELDTDPLAIGYASLPLTQIAKKFNDPDENPGGETAARPFDASALMDALSPADYGAAQTNVNAAEYVLALLHYGDVAPYKAKFESLFAANSATRTALAAQTAALSRGEVLFGQGTLIETGDIVAARELVV